jgi:hypothetical protein
MNLGFSFAVSNHLTAILPLLGERAGVRASFLQPRNEALINRAAMPRLCRKDSLCVLSSLRLDFAHELHRHRGADL